MIYYINSTNKEKSRCCATVPSITVNNYFHDFNIFFFGQINLIDMVQIT